MNVPNTPPFPASITFGQVDYTVHADEQRARDAQVAFGFTVMKHAAIVLNLAQAPAQLRATLLHETLHAICFAIGVTKGGYSALLDDGAEERLVHPFATLLRDVLRRDPALVAYLLAP